MPCSVSSRAVATVLAAAASLFAPGRSLAGTDTALPAAGGTPATDVTVDLASAEIRGYGGRWPIPIDRAKLPAEKDVTVEAIDVGLGKHVVHVRVPLKDDPAGVAWEAVLGPGKPQPIFAGLTGRTAGDPGERTGKAVKIVRAGSASFVLVGDIREELTICGEAETLIDPKAVYPEDLTLRPATVQRLDEARQANAERITATDAGLDAPVPLAKLLVARGSSVPGSLGSELTDGDPRTTWTERRPGVGQGEFVVMAAPRDVPIARMRVVVAPNGPPLARGAAPKTFYLVTSTQSFQVTLPDGAWLKPGESYEVAFPRPIDASCVAVVLDSAESRDLPHPDVGLTELVAYSEFDAPGATLDDVARALGGERKIAAAQVLERAGDAALAAVERAYDGLDVRGRALAIDVAASHERCEDAAPLLAKALCERDGEAPRKAHEKLERCAGAAQVLASRLRDDPASRACVAPTLAALSPESALEPIADAIGATPEGDAATRAALREAFSLALEGNPDGKLPALLSDARRSPIARLEILRAAKDRATQAPTESDATVAALLAGAPTLRVRYLVLAPLETLARAGDRSASARIVDAITHDEAWPVRARAAEAGTGLADAAMALVSAAQDPEPRVREAALQALSASSSPSPGGIDVAASTLGKDGWPFVRAQAVAVLAKAPASGSIDDALARALHDGSVGVRGAAVVGLARHRAGAHKGEIRALLDQVDEDVDVRAAAAQALGALCDFGSADRLTDLARTLAEPSAGEEQQAVAVGALVALAALQPNDLKSRLAPLLAPSSPAHVRAAAAQALAARSTCR
ncbi:MAG TPA: HEAT repeat domain-containing protein [Polyangiaceae bacterium]|jgi:hypothetical protein